MSTIHEPSAAGLEVRDVASKGRGVYAGGPFRKGELVTEAPVIVIPQRQWKAVEATIIGDYCFAWGHQDRQAALVLGIGSLFNHTVTPNCEPLRDEDRTTMRFVATRDIAEGEEIMISYRDPQDDPRPLWFDAVE